MKEVRAFCEQLPKTFEKFERDTLIMQDLLKFACSPHIPQEVRDVIATFSVEDYTFLIDGKRVRFETEYNGCTGGTSFDVKTSYDSGETWSKPVDVYTLEKEVELNPLWKSLEYRFAWWMIVTVAHIFPPE